MRARFGLFVCVTLTSSCLDAAEPSAADVEFFEKRIRPVLAERCYDCHSVSADKVKGGLLLDSHASILKGGDTGPAIIAGDADASLLIQAVR